MSDTAADWQERAAAHRRRADLLLGPHVERRQAGLTHPVFDFLFTYYSLRPRHLRVWHPGYGVALTGPGAEAYVTRTGYRRDGAAVAVSRDHLMTRSDTVRFIAELLSATASRPPRFSCFGMHEWAMVYRSTQVRHGTVPLRLGPAGTDAVVESMPLRCSHFDAYRFFTSAAAPRNARRLTRATQVLEEQPGCVHAGMDLYKWAAKLGPLIESSLLLDCFELALDARVLDMRASPYDLRDFGFTPIRVETASGRAQYAAAQEAVTVRAAPLRARLIDACLALGRAAALTCPGGVFTGGYAGSTDFTTGTPRSDAQMPPEEES
ncbi:3-methyladenine DNA glycosylase [Mycolicibacterium sp. 018/SC-01/001]|uniref:3-methyladenine DNA glycosylase n=1 Tax=Mycolicibacterium sp. 018/SC-01/001 TaxID=2592069 RepID=UPI0021054D7C|nr:3-methyladenine DNA glycosylase [Mycolicibacterium sp. 018/SC-01/001]